MLFDFFKERAKEGIAQVQNIATKTMEGKLQEALSDSAQYIQTRQKIDSENLKNLFFGKASFFVLSVAIDSFNACDRTIKVA